ncbi:hypothetical protein I2492_01155 [Budviciaceae bacterium CWB-B4]|uniref:Uncharacterized protein n=1 Tax=Limnobaculum xujianqingii TaxID=2738837 RepID=A0A9D7AFA9_9GAMM|nr:hypothetical protein [Limnobaculum xujianqingii]MBK5071622.1 hypothetical protein [Limnobaculum xujianqingii]MBK5174931.1 hypothetical protein [Limnobaculum xujianqingii]
MRKKNIGQTDTPLENINLAEVSKVFRQAIIRAQYTALLCGLSGMLFIEISPLFGMVGFLAGLWLMGRYRFSSQRALLFRYAKTLPASHAIWLELSPRGMWLFVLCLVMVCAVLGRDGWAMWPHVNGFAAFGTLAGLFGFYGWYRGLQLLRTADAP